MSQWFTQKNKHLGTGIKERILEGETIKVVFLIVQNHKYLENQLIKKWYPKYNKAIYNYHGQI